MSTRDSGCISIPTRLKITRQLARYIKGQRTLPWIMSYDDTDVVRELYCDQQLTSLPIHYSLQTKRSAKELIIAPYRLALPQRLHCFKGKRPS